jgi:hypothetical protein
MMLPMVSNICGGTAKFFCVPDVGVSGKAARITMMNNRDIVNESEPSPGLEQLLSEKSVLFKSKSPGTEIRVELWDSREDRP